MARLSGTPFCLLIAGLLLAQALAPAQAADASVEDLMEQNRRLQDQVREQQRLIDGLTARMADVVKATERHDHELESLQGRLEDQPAEKPPAANRDQEIRISAEAGLAFFSTGSAGQFPNSEFRVDDAKVFLEAPVWKNTYFLGELDLVTREANDEFFHLGELYVDFENVSALWGKDRLLNVRAGRFYIPFGEDYQVRGVMDNPLISHSISDIWGVDEGVEFYGGAAGLQYAVAVQNGGHKTLHDFDSDKSVAARVGFKPIRWLHLSASAMRTGNLSAAGDAMSETWFANGFFRALGPAATTPVFHASLAELDGAVTWKTGHVRALAGEAKFGDDDPAADNSRELRYYSLEGVQKFGDALYGAARFGRIHAPRGYPLVGQGDFGTYFFRSPLTDSLQRLSLGVGYRFGPPLIWKAEYNIERGRLVTGAARDQEDLISTEIAIKF